MLCPRSMRTVVLYNLKTNVCLKCVTEVDVVGDDDEDANVSVANDDDLETATVETFYPEDQAAPQQTRGGT